MKKPSHYSSGKGSISVNNKYLQCHFSYSHKNFDYLFSFPKKMGERLCQWLHCALLREHDTALKSARLISDLTNYDMKQQIKGLNDTDRGKKEKWKDLDPNLTGSVLAPKKDERSQEIFSHLYRYLRSTNSKRVQVTRCYSGQHFPGRLSLEHRG